MLFLTFQDLKHQYIIHGEQAEFASFDAECQCATSTVIRSFRFLSSLWP